VESPERAEQQESNSPAEPATPAHRPSNRFIAGVIVGVMAIVALLSVVFVWDPDLIRADDIHLPRRRAISIPFLLRFALGVYIFALVYAVVRGFSRRSSKSDSPDHERRPVSLSFTMVAVAAAIGLILVVMVIQTRPGRRIEPEKHQPEQKLIHRKAGRELEGLGYLPENTLLVVGLHVAELMKSEYGEQVLTLAGQFGLDEIEKKTGLQLEACDHLVVGLSGEKNKLQLTFVLYTRQPYDQAALAKAIGSQRVGQYLKKPVYSVRWKAPPETLLWCAEPRVLVAVYRPGGVSVENLLTIPTPPRTGAQKLPAALQTLLKDRPISVGTPFWAAGRFRHADILQGLLGRAPFLQNKELQILALIRSFRLGLRFDREVSLIVELQGNDVTAARQLAHFLDGVHKIVLRFNKQIVCKLSRDPEANWVLLQVKADRETTRMFLQGSNKRKAVQAVRPK
jgi:hypothetical protein